MSITMLIIIAGVGAAAGWIADRLAIGKGFGPSGDAVIGIVGAFAGVLAARQFGVALMPGVGGIVIHAAAGAVVLLAIARVSQSGLGTGSAAAAKPVDAPAAKPAAPKPAFRPGLRQATAAAPAPAVRPERPAPRQGR